MAETKQVVTTVEAAKVLGVTLGWIYSLIRMGELPAERRNRRWVIPIQAVEQRLRSHSHREQ